jgi:hypothetical protein
VQCRCLRYANALDQFCYFVSSSAAEPNTRQP